MRSRVRATLHQLGWVCTSLYALARLLATLSGGRCDLFLYRLVAQPVTGASLCGGRGKAITVRQAAELDALPAGFPRRAEVLVQRYRDGAECLVATRAGELLGFLWLTRRAYHEDEVRALFTLTSEALVWDFDLDIMPQHRIGLGFARLWDEANTVLRARGVRWSCSRISAFNRSSLGAHARLGTRHLGSAAFLCLGRWQWMLATCAPYFHLSRHAGAIPQFHLALEPSCKPSIVSN